MYKVHPRSPNHIVECFTPDRAAQISGTYTPTEIEIIKLGNDVDITIDGILVGYTAGAEICLVPSVSYTFSIATNVHKM